MCIPIITSREVGFCDFFSLLLYVYAYLYLI